MDASLIEKLAKYKSSNPNQSWDRKSGKRNILLKATYGITISDYNAMYLEQDGRCHICKEFRKPHRLVVDHDHETGKVRRLLCHRCNTAVGYFELFMKNGLFDKTMKYISSAKADNP